MQRFMLTVVTIFLTTQLAFAANSSTNQDNAAKKMSDALRQSLNPNNHKDNLVTKNETKDIIVVYGGQDVLRNPVQAQKSVDVL